MSLACDLLMSKGDDLQAGLAKVFQFATNNTNNEKTADFRYSTSIEPLKNLSLDSSLTFPFLKAFHTLPTEYSGWRAWTWMTCNQFGWYQTTDKENSIFGDIISLGF